MTEKKIFKSSTFISKIFITPSCFSSAECAEGDNTVFNFTNRNFIRVLENTTDGSSLSALNALAGSDDSHMLTMGGSAVVELKDVAAYDVMIKTLHFEVVMFAQGDVLVEVKREGRPNLLRTIEVGGSWEM